MDTVTQMKQLAVGRLPALNAEIDELQRQINDKMEARQILNNFIAAVPDKQKVIPRPTPRMVPNIAAPIIALPQVTNPNLPLLNTFINKRTIRGGKTYTKPLTDAFNSDTKLNLSYNKAMPDLMADYMQSNPDVVRDEDSQGVYYNITLMD